MRTQPTKDDGTAIWLWSNLPEAVGAWRVETGGSPGLAELQCTRWRVERSRSLTIERSRSPAIERSRSPAIERSRSPGVEGMFGRVEAVRHGEVGSLGDPRAVLLGFAAAVLACNILAVLPRCGKQAHQSLQGVALKTVPERCAECGRVGWLWRHGNNLAPHPA